jgi:hypothetical protein
MSGTPRGGPVGAEGDVLLTARSCEPQGRVGGLHQGG